MCLFDSQLTADQVLRAYHHDAPLLFLSSAFITVAVVAAAFCAIRRRFDPLLVNLALFAYLYGQRLRFDSSIFHLGMSHGPLFLRLGKALFYLVPMPAFGFFEAAGFMGRRGKFIAFSACGILLGLILATLISGPKHVFDNINNSVVLVSLLAVMIQSFRHGAGEQDVVVLRAGLLCFVVGAFCDNIVGFYRTPQRIEPYGFALFLAALGYVAARRVLRRDQKLADLQSELDLARHIQLSILPGNFPTSAAFRVAARYVPMTSVAGDFYDFIVADDNQAGLLIADVSGHGVPAALIASMVKMAATSQRTNADAPAQLLTGMNAALCGNTQSQFVTAAYIHLDAGTREFSYAAAGHPPMLLLRDGLVTEVEENGLILAILPNAAYTQRSQPLLAGDRLILYTDGLVEAADSRQEFFGQANLHAAVRETATLHPSDAANSIIRSVQKWAPSQDDDLTILVCDFIGPAILAT
jgi:sigma-B regulation protein RsbU (phosphoserine phosphatase)